jgi:hypothetical protein
MNTSKSIIAVLLLAGGLAGAAPGERTLRGGVPGFAKSSKPIGAHAAGDTISVDIMLHTRNVAAQKKLVDQGKTVTPQEWNARFAPTAAQIAGVEAWAKQQGLTVTNAVGETVQVRGTTAELEKAFAVKINDYNVPGQPQVVRSNANNVSVPRDLKQISAVIGFDDAQVARPLHRSLAAKNALVK